MRTVEAFVADLLGKGRTPSQVRTIAAVTRWADKRAEVEAELEKRATKKRR